MDHINLIGAAAGIITVGSLMPQTYRVWQTRSTKDLSAASYSMMIVGAVLWLTYGVLRADMPIIVPNTAVLVMLVMIMVAKVRFK